MNVKTKLRESDFPTVNDIAAALPSFVSWFDGEPVDGEDSLYLDVRLQVWEDGTWTLHTGDSQYDQDHGGFWGCGSYAAGDDIGELARSLRSEALDHAWECDAMEDSAVYLDDVPAIPTASAAEAFEGRKP